ncbi:YopX family protein [Streptococcus pneumoniae]|nr:YopX family protein [Streptococcus pneumoniae]MDS3275510.1 YopX family protein [Streptococcus pneumoniae]MDS3280033.1 YopX family protein [Streptococcus pneumoniae]MDS3301358.1 YopX family protein [Streptococcus pneumoniae]MDS3378220.1 YopX family protein [Streptococcus pneumoniae]MDS3416416.1 YopX family protein [Streptococcus pneumoniae]
MPKFRVWHYELGRLMSVKCMFFQDSEIEEFELNDALMNDCITAYPDEIELMQSTGILDKNGKEIFEGDILKFNDEWNEYCHEGYVDGSVEGVNYVEVVKGEACFEFGKTRYPESSLFIYMEDEHLSFAELVKDKDFGFEIIGNIYENLVFLEDK